MTPLLCWDASALVKRYSTEVGSEVVEAIIQAVPPGNHVTTLWCYVECCSILQREHNSGLLSVAAHRAATLSLEAEVLNSPRFGLLSIDDSRVTAAIPMIERHHLNTSDGAILATFLRYSQSLPAGSPTCVLAASDRRLLRAASAEGLLALNPEVTTEAEVVALVGGAAS